jgi:hypothetical protein
VVNLTAIPFVDIRARISNFEGNNKEINEY